MSGVRIVLRYFPVLGRAQALRHSLADAGLDFEDLRVLVSDWPRFREDVAFSGQYRALPTLSWGDVTVSEALPIASFIARQLNQYEGLGEDAITHREAICSSCYIDILLPFADLIRADVMYPGADAGRGLATIAPRILKKMDVLDRQIPETTWIGGDNPVVPDFFLSEAFELLRYMLGPDRDAALRVRLPRLATLAREVSLRPRLIEARKNRPTRFTARPDEDRIVEQLHATDLSSARL